MAICKQWLQKLGLKRSFHYSWKIANSPLPQTILYCIDDGGKEIGGDTAFFGDEIFFEKFRKMGNRIPSTCNDLFGNASGGGSEGRPYERSRGGSTFVPGTGQVGSNKGATRPGDFGDGSRGVGSGSWSPGGNTSMVFRSTNGSLLTVSPQPRR